MKSILQSRTIWLAVIQAVAGILVVVFTELNMPGAVLIVKSFIDIILRLDTSNPVDISPLGFNK